MTMTCGKAFRWSAGVAFAATTALAQGGDGRPPTGSGVPGRCGDRLVRALGLTREQQAALDALNTETTETTRPLLDQIRAIYDLIQAATSASNKEACAIGALVLQSQGLDAQVGTIRDDAEAKFVASLTADQKATYDSFVAANPGCTAVGAVRSVSPDSSTPEPVARPGLTAVLR